MARLRGRSPLGLLVTLNVSGVLGGLTIAGVLTVWTHYGRALTTARSSAEAEMVSIVVATRELEFGRGIEADDVMLFEVPSAIVAPDAQMDLVQVIGRVPVERLLPGEAVRDARLSRPGAGTDLDAVLAAGTRAQMLDLTYVESGAGMIEPGDRVDVIATVFDADGPTETHTIVRGVRVLAVDDRLLAQEARGTPLKTGITLEVTPEDAQRLAHGARTGPLHLTAIGAIESTPYTLGHETVRERIGAPAASLGPAPVGARRETRR